MNGSMKKTTKAVYVKIRRQINHYKCWGSSSRPTYFLPDNDAESMVNDKSHLDESVDNVKQSKSSWRRYLCFSCGICGCCSTMNNIVHLTTKPKGKKKKKRDSKADARGPEDPIIPPPPFVHTPDTAATMIQSLARKLIARRLRHEQWLRAKSASDAYWAEVAKIEEMTRIARLTRLNFINQYVTDVLDTSTDFLIQTTAAVCIQRYFRGWNVRRKMVPINKPVRYWLKRQGAKPRFGKPTYRRVWARTEYEPAGGYPALDAMAKLDYDVNLWQYSEQVPRTDKFGLRTIKVPLGALTLKEDFILCSRNQAWVGIPVYLAPNKSKKLKSVVHTMLTMPAPETAATTRAIPSPQHAHKGVAVGVGSPLPTKSPRPKSPYHKSPHAKESTHHPMMIDGSTNLLADLTSDFGLGVGINEHSFLTLPTSPPPSRGQGRMKDIFEQAEAEEHALPHLTPVQLRYAAFNSPYAQKLSNSQHSQPQHQPLKGTVAGVGNSVLNSAPSMPTGALTPGKPQKSNVGHIETHHYKLLKNLGWNPTGDYPMPADNGDEYFRQIYEEYQLTHQLPSQSQPQQQLSQQQQLPHPSQDSFLDGMDWMGKDGGFHPLGANEDTRIGLGLGVDTNGMVTPQRMLTSGGNNSRGGSPSPSAGVDMSILSRPTVRLTVEAQAAAAYGASPSQGNVYVNPVTHTPSRGAAKPRLLSSTGPDSKRTRQPPPFSPTLSFSSPKGTEGGLFHVDQRRGSSHKGDSIKEGLFNDGSFKGGSGKGGDKENTPYQPTNPTDAATLVFSSATDRGIKVDMSAYSLHQDLDESGAGGISDTMYAKYVSGPWGGFMRKLFKGPSTTTTNTETGTAGGDGSNKSHPSSSSGKKSPSGKGASTGEHGSDIIKSRSYLDHMKNKTALGVAAAPPSKLGVALAVAKIKPRRHFATQYTWLPQLLVKAAVNSDRFDRASNAVYPGIYETVPPEETFFEKARREQQAMEEGQGLDTSTNRHLSTATLTQEQLKTHFQGRFGHNEYDTHASGDVGGGGCDLEAMGPTTMEWSGKDTFLPTLRSPSANSSSKSAKSLRIQNAQSKNLPLPSSSDPLPTMPTMHTMGALRDIHMGDNHPYRSEAEKERDLALRDNDFYYARGPKSSSFKDSTLRRHDLFSFHRESLWPVEVQKQHRAGAITIPPESAPSSSSPPVMSTSSLARSIRHRNAPQDTLALTHHPSKGGLLQTGRTATVVNHFGEWGHKTIEVSPSHKRTAALKAKALGVDGGINVSDQGTLQHPYTFQV